MIVTSLLPSPTLSVTARDALSPDPCAAVRMTMAAFVQELGGAGAEIAVADPPVTVSVTGPATPSPQPSATS